MADRESKPRKANPLGASSLAREDRVILLSSDEFERWAAERLARVQCNPEAEAEVRQAIDGDRKLRAWAKQEGQRQQAEMRGQLSPRARASESVLEDRMLAAFMESGEFREPRAVSDLVVGHGALGLLLQQLCVTSSGASYRLDFAIMDPAADVFLAVEVDGFEWHERTREQAQRDRQRDRILTGAGWRVLRFLGAEVHRSPEACVQDVCLIARQVQRHREQEGQAG